MSANTPRQNQCEKGFLKNCNCRDGELSAMVKHSLFFLTFSSLAIIYIFSFIIGRDGRDGQQGRKEKFHDMFVNALGLSRHNNLTDTQYVPHTQLKLVCAKHAQEQYQMKDWLPIE